MKKTIQVAHMMPLRDRRSKGPRKAFSVFFYVIGRDGIKACVVAVWTDNPVEALRMAKAFHPKGMGFCFSDGDGSLFPPARPRPALVETMALNF